MLTIESVDRNGSVVVACSKEREFRADAVVIASGAWLSRLASSHSVDVPVYAGRGYSFTLPADVPLAYPVHFPATRLALTPAGDRIRVVGVMEFTDPDAPLAKARIKSMVRTLKPLITGVDWDGRSDDWVGAAPPHVRWAACHRTHRDARRLRRWRAWHVGHDPWTGDRITARPGDRDRSHADGAGSLQPAAP